VCSVDINVEQTGPNFSFTPTFLGQNSGKFCRSNIQYYIIVPELKYNFAAINTSSDFAINTKLQKQVLQLYT